MAIQQHPIPQDISNYKFRLIGDMTIKQFASLGISIVVSVIIYSSPLPFFFKYPLSFIFLVLGVGMAFVPVQGRTLDIWIIAFIKSIYSPTQYIWKHGQESPTVTPTNPPVDITPPTTPVVNITPPATEETQTPTIIPEVETSKTTPAEPAPTQPEPTPQVETPPTPQPETKTETQSQPTEPVPPSANNPSLPIPYTPTTPNTLVGLSLNKEGKILDGVLIEIKQQDFTLRATKSNKLGQFLFARPLENGLYQILAEKEGFKFETYSIELTGEIIMPLKIQAIS